MDDKKDPAGSGIPVILGPAATAGLLGPGALSVDRWRAGRRQPRMP